MAPLSPEEAHDLVAWAGGQRAAARAADVPRRTLRGWLAPEDPEAHRQRNRDWFAGLDGLAYNRRLLYMRRVKALHRRAKRNQEEAISGPLPREG